MEINHSDSDSYREVEIYVPTVKICSGQNVIYPLIQAMLVSSSWHYLKIIDFCRMKFLAGEFFTDGDNFKGIDTSIFCLPSLLLQV